MTPRPAPGLAFVRRIQTDERYRGSPIFIPEQARDKVSQCQWEIVAVGAPEPCDDVDECERAHGYDGDFAGNPAQWGTGRAWHRCDLAPGDWVLVRKRSETPTPEPELFAVRCDAVIGRFLAQEEA